MSAANAGANDWIKINEDSAVAAETNEVKWWKEWNDWII